MCKDDEDCGWKCHTECHGGHHMGHLRGFGVPLMSIDEEVKTLEEIKGTLGKRLEIVNKRLDVLKR
ncbi:hypothetical protein MUP77_16085 [Candidatus Bathyarchaeota archaeon]|nr:hypothetical protein [Candidatus Bathyarchaeota archaeon]